MNSSSEILSHLSSSSSNAVGGSQSVTQLFTRKELVGKGAYGGVYKGIHNATGLVVALKVIDLDTPDDDISEIQKEVALLSEMRDANKHNITLYHGCYLHGHELWIAMDFASGGSIRTLMKSGSIEEKYIVLILREVLVALSFLHRQGIIHRDVKAANILLTQAGKILLCDFGVAAHLQTNNKRSTFIGTPLWMAPEVITDGKLYDTKADIWSLGVTLYEIATGNPPYFGMEPMRACAIIPRTAPAKLDGGNWSAMMREFLGFCLQIDPTSRPTADELSRTKWIKSGAKLPMSLLRELIVRYVSWIQTGGQRASLAGLDSIAREDTFEIEEDKWDFGDEDEEEYVEPLGDEPPRSLDAQAAKNQLRPPKPTTISRNHPLLRLFDEETNPYAQSNSPTAINLPTAMGSAYDTVKPTISIPSFDDMDDMFSSSGAPVKFGGASAANELMSPIETGPGSNPFPWAVHTSSLPFAPPTPKFGANVPHDETDGPWGNTTPTEATFPPIPMPTLSTTTSNTPYPVVASPSLPTVALDRPPAALRRRADTAPSSDYPPLGPGLPSSFNMTKSNPSNNVNGSTHSATTSISSANSGFGFSNNSSISSTTDSSTFSTSPTSFTNPINRSPKRTRAGTLNNAPSTGGELSKGFKFGGSSSTTAATSRNRSDSKTALKINITPHHRTSSTSFDIDQLAPAATKPYDGGPFDFPTPLASTSNHHALPTTAVPGFPFPSLDDEDEESSDNHPDEEEGFDDSDPDSDEDDDDEEEGVWIVEGPELKPLDYAQLRDRQQVEKQLEITLGGLGDWLKIVEAGLERILKDAPNTATAGVNTREEVKSVIET